jgi:hypothetical protein
VAQTLEGESALVGAATIGRSCDRRAKAEQSGGRAVFGPAGQSGAKRRQAKAEQSGGRAVFGPAGQNGAKWRQGGLRIDGSERTKISDRSRRGTPVCRGDDRAGCGKSPQKPAFSAMSS